MPPPGASTGRYTIPWLFLGSTGAALPRALAGIR